MERHRGAGAVLTTIVAVAETGSTNADLLAASASGAAEATWLRADRQLAGRGRQGRAWHSPPGNLYASTLIRLRPTDPPAPSLSLVAGVALHEALVAFVPDGARPLLKWPNDVLIDGAKLAGILLERNDQAIVAGFGVNLTHCPDVIDRPTTTLEEHGVVVAAAAFCETLAECFARWLGQWRGQGLAPVRDRWLASAHPVGTAVCVHAPDQSRVEGLFDGLTEDGALRLRLADGGAHVMHAGDVFLI